jgi:hypothetical protein
MGVRQAGKTDYIDGVLVPKGTYLYIPIRVVNTWKEIWGDDAEECVSLARYKPDVNLTLILKQIQAQSLAQPSAKIRPGDFIPYIPCWSTRLHRKRYGNLRNEGCHCSSHC